MKILVVLLSIFFLKSGLHASVFTEKSVEQIPLELNITCNGIDKLLNLINRSSCSACESSCDETSDKILQLVEDILSAVQLELTVFSILVAIFISGAGFSLFKSQANLKKGLKQAQERLDSQYKELKDMTSTVEEQYRSQLEEVEYISNKAKAKLKETKLHLKSLDETDILTTTRISAIQKTLVLCLEIAPSRNIAFATYSKLLSAYELLLNETSKVEQEEMEMAATLIYGNKRYVPKEIIRFMIEHMNLPYEVREILWGKS